jgi:hypothetical protein
MLADSVESINGKLYMMGGGWDTMKVASIDIPHKLSFACGISVPWNATDEDHTLAVTIEDTDGQQVAPPLSVTFKTGRSPNLERGAATRIPFAVKAEIKFPAFGAYVLTGRVDDREDGTRRMPFFMRPIDPSAARG